MSLLESKETIDPETLEQIAKTLKVPVDAIKNNSEEATINNIQNNSDGFFYEIRSKARKLYKA